MDGRRIALTILVAGTLDIASAFIFAGMNGGTPTGVLTAVASGPFGAMQASVASAALGLAVHFAIMAAMVAAYALAADRAPGLLRRVGPVVAGIGYGLALYLFMYWIVLPLRWPTLHPLTDVAQIGKAVFAHVACVGLPIAFMIGPRGAPAARAVEA
jgi:hypothetical protein